MKTFDRTLCINAGLLGILVFVVVLWRGDTALRPSGIGVLLFGLVVSSFVVLRG